MWLARLHVRLDPVLRRSARAMRTLQLWRHHMELGTVNLVNPDYTVMHVSVTPDSWVWVQIDIPKRDRQVLTYIPRIDPSFMQLLSILFRSWAFRVFQHPF